MKDWSGFQEQHSFWCNYDEKGIMNDGVVPLESGESVDRIRWQIQSFTRQTENPPPGRVTNTTACLALPPCLIALFSRFCRRRVWPWRKSCVAYGATRSSTPCSPPSSPAWRERGRRWSGSGTRCAALWRACAPPSGRYGGPHQHTSEP